MHIEFTIPIWIFQVLATYYLTGVLAYCPLYQWSAKFISPRRRGRAAWQGMTTKRIIIGALFASALFWPAMVIDLLKDERKYGSFKNS